MKSRTEGVMNALPLESPRWREHLKQRIRLETAILRALIQWGMAESASDVCRSLEAHFSDALEVQVDSSLRQPVRPSGQDRAFVRELLREAYLRTREIPRRGVTQERLHDGLLTGFEELSLDIFQCYEGFLLKTACSAEKAA
ncbi:MAG: hypothetical protein EXQ58_04020 [Acidobacteria bacterium]|nr:hypothetical protein [Acidobacteriota bacterium]